jgi:hypothetical protein
MKYKIAVGLFSAAMFAGAVATTNSFADDYGYHNPNRGFESSRGVPGGDPDEGWHQFLNNGSNSDFAHRYRENPNIIYDKQVMAHEPGVRAYLNAHPDERERLYGQAGAAKEHHWEKKHERRSWDW